ncbi:hypothetical protein BJF78_07385 [Pseudonocardia sp. CNS-139]|nr:hypothetical protein BJF78_07385 [Pseudonocardia sp. CNS-139]
MNDPETWRQQLREPDGAAALPPDIDITVPSVARMYDYALGGKTNFEADRQALDGLNKEIPGVAALATDNREFLRRGVRFLVAEAGIRQIIDVGSGLPTAGNVHDIAHAIDPGVRVVYVDNDPLVLAHGHALLADNDTTLVIQADAADPAAILDHPVTRGLLDLGQPYAVVLVGLLHWLSDEQDPVGVTTYFREYMPAGSYLLASNLLDDELLARDIEYELLKRVGVGTFRPWEQHRKYFDGLDLVPPGLVYANDWRTDGTRPEHDPTLPDYTTYLTGGCGRKP